MDLKNRLAVITGAGRGIGQATAYALATHGATVALLDQDGETAQRAAAPLPAATAWTCDVADRQQVAQTFHRIADALGPIHILVNNAGIWRPTPVLEAAEADWDRVFAVNVKGMLFCSQAVALGMVARREGKIVNIASVAGFGGSANWSAYCAAKAAAISLTLALADALDPHDIQVNAVCPGATRTALLEAIERAESGSTFDWMHTPQEVATEVLQLIAPWTDKPQGRVVAMKPSSAVLGIPVQLD